jgi:general secretion pathway protein D
MSDEKLPLLPKWNDKLTLPPTFDEYMKDNDLTEPTLLPPTVDDKDDESASESKKD